MSLDDRDAGESSFDLRFLLKVDELAQAIILVLDKEGKIVSANRHLETVTGYRPAEVIGKDWFTTLLPPRDQGRIAAVYQRALGADVTGNVNPIVTKTGE